MFWIFLYSGNYIAWYTCFGYFCTVESILRGTHVLDIFVLWNLYSVAHMFWIFLYCGIYIAWYTCFGYFCTVESILRGTHVLDIFVLWNLYCVAYIFKDLMGPFQAIMQTSINMTSKVYVQCLKTV